MQCGTKKGEKMTSLSPKLRFAIQQLIEYDQKQETATNMGILRDLDNDEFHFVMGLMLYGRNTWDKTTNLPDCINFGRATQSQDDLGIGYLATKPLRDYLPAGLKRAGL